MNTLLLGLLLIVIGTWSIGCAVIVAKRKAAQREDEHAKHKFIG